jgi:ABC-type Fe3+-hydroxamate transport system substrate-binding protein
MPVHKDQMHREVCIPHIPQRIISLVPSQTELLFDLGLEKEVIGITKFCIHPEHWFRNKTRVGGTKTVKTDIVRSLQPDLVIANKEENTKSQLEELEKIAPVWISDIQNIAGALNMMQSIGEITGKKEESAALIVQIKKDLDGLAKMPAHKNYRAAYLIWKEPYMAAGGDTFISDMMRLAGWTNIFSGAMRYPEVTIKELHEKNTELLLLSSEPFPFKQKHIHELQVQLPGTKIVLVDGEIFSWYGSRMKFAAGYIAKLLQHLK